MASSEQSYVPAELRAEISKLKLPPLIHRDFVEICSDTGDVVRVMQWNILAHGLSGGADNFIKCPKEALELESRKLRVLEEVTRYRPTVMCLEEVDFYEYLFDNLSKLGYAGIFSPKPDSPCLYQNGNIGPDGSAIFYDTSKLVLSKSDSIILKEDGYQSNHVTIIAQFQTNTDDPKMFYVGVTHLKAKRGYEGKRKLQGEFLSNYLQENCNDAPVIYCGDFNAEPIEPVYSVMKLCAIGLSSAYTVLSGNNTEPKYTTWKIRPKGEECHTIDYIWYSNKGLKVKSVLDVASEEEIGKNRLPSFKYPSDHLSLVCDFLVL
ncbi:nocturnin-like [Mercenaria mercenaria]|uniref:nocturnin-like n=1 Tax=Mercenaria mercenaria TaxID=6596 RepID=UPI00234F1F0A|nr:nocturnin-like [Mercenaria mercenaria]XP_053400032.1 nocturnin-like [Mercenaria mercenaria]